MAKEIIKKDGTVQPFDEMKIRRSIEKATEDAGMSPEKSAPVVQQTAEKALAHAASKDTITTAELKAEILQNLETAAPEAAAAWKKYAESSKGA